MPMDDRALADALRRSMPQGPDAPPFDDAWAAAEARSRRRPHLRHAAVAAGIAIVAGFLAMNLDQTPAPAEASIGDQIMTSTRWAAPSDVLLPRREIDIYRELPSLETSTDVEDGTLL
jgi:hypothetical protein